MLIFCAVSCCALCFFSCNIPNSGFRSRSVNRLYLIRERNERERVCFGDSSSDESSESSDSALAAAFGGAFVNGTVEV